VRLAGRPARPAGPRRSGEEGGLWWSSEQSNSGAGRKERGEDNADRWARGIGGRESECWRGLLGLACVAGEQEWLKRTGPARRGRPGKGVARTGLGSGERAGRARVRGLGRGKRWAGLRFGPS